MLASWLSKLLLCRESPAVSMTKACGIQTRMVPSADVCPPHDVLMQKIRSLAVVKGTLLAGLPGTLPCFQPSVIHANMQVKAFRGWAPQVLSYPDNILHRLGMSALLCGC